MPRKKPAPIDIIQVASHPSRWAMLQALDRPLNSQELSEETGLSQHNIAWHARLLRRHGLVSVMRDKALATRLIYTRVPFSAGILVKKTTATAGVAISSNGSSPDKPQKFRPIKKLRKLVR